MSKLVRVSQLKVGDQFKFLSGRTDGPLTAEEVSTFEVVRVPAVNLAANTCFFRYRAAGPGNGSSHQDSQSFNGAPDVQVELPGAEPDAAAPAVPFRPKAETFREVAPPVEAKPVKKRAVKKAASKGPDSSETPVKTAPLPPLPERTSEPRQRAAILPSLSKAAPAKPARKKAAPTKGADDGPAKKKRAAAAAPKKAKKPTKKK
jgi:hypothetical protein